MAREQHAREGSGARRGEAAVSGRLLVAAAAAAVAALPAFAQSEDLDTPFVITPTNVVTAMLDVAGVRAGDRLIDLGSGDGRIVLAAAQRGATGVGIEIDAALVEKSRAAARRMKLDDRATFVTQDLFETDFSGYDVVTLYLLPDVNKRLAPKLFALAPGTRIVSHDYDLGAWPPDATLVVDAPDKPVNAIKKSHVYYWRVPARVHGGWHGEAAGRPIALDLAQHFQFVTGLLEWQGRRYALPESRLNGDRMTLSGGGAKLDLDLRKDGERLVGEIRAAGRAPVAVSLRR
jgi:SAM-dependent methyltransferase